MLVTAQYAAAVPLLAGIDRQAVSQMNADPDYGDEVDLMRAAAPLGMGDTVAGDALLAKVKPVFLRPDADTYMRRRAAQLAASGAPQMSAKSRD